MLYGKGLVEVSIQVGKQANVHACRQVGRQSYIGRQTDVQASKQSYRARI